MSGCFFSGVNMKERHMLPNDCLKAPRRYNLRSPKFSIDFICWPHVDGEKANASKKASQKELPKTKSILGLVSSSPFPHILQFFNCMRYASSQERVLLLNIIEWYEEWSASNIEDYCGCIFKVPSVISKNFVCNLSIWFHNSR